MEFSHEFWFQIAVYVVGGFVFVAINAFKIGQLEAKLATKDELREKVKERNDQINRVYERFDVYKKHTEDNFVRREMCGQLHLTTKDDLKRMDEEYRQFRHDIRNQIQMLVDKIDQLRELIQKG